MRVVFTILLLVFSNVLWAQIKELDEVKNLQINERSNISSLESFGKLYVDLLNAENDELLFEFLASEKLIKKTLKKSKVDRDVAEEIEKETQGNFDKRVMAQNLKLLKKLRKNIDKGPFQFVSITIDSAKQSESFNGLAIVGAKLCVKKEGAIYTIIVEKLLQTYKGWRALQITDYFAELTAMD